MTWTAAACCRFGDSQPAVNQASRLELGTGAQGLLEAVAEQGVEVVDGFHGGGSGADRMLQRLLSLFRRQGVVG